MTELATNKVNEIFTESIPGIIIQLASIFATITAGNKSVATMSFVSFFVSILTTAFVSAQISYGKSFDSKPNRHFHNNLSHPLMYFRFRHRPDEKSDEPWVLWLCARQVSTLFYPPFHPSPILILSSRTSLYPLVQENVRSSSYVAFLW